LFTDRWGEKEYYEAEKKTSAAEIAEICGLPLSPSYSLSRILYLKERKPEVYKKISRILLIQDFINYMFSGETGADYSTACRTMLFDVRNCEWSVPLLEKFGLQMGHYTSPKPMGSVLGKVRRTLLDELGLKDDIEVIVGGHDQPLNAIGAGLKEGYAVNSMGTSECITPITHGMLPGGFIASRGIPSEPLWAKNKFCCLAYNTTAGLLVQWFANMVAGEQESSLAYMNQYVPAEPTRIMVQPYLMGSGTPYMDGGARLALAGMDYGTTKFTIFRALLEGLALDQRLNLSVLAEEQVQVEHLIAVGGGSQSKPWLQIKADILEIPVSTLKEKEAGALGAAILCAAASGVYGSIEEAAAEMSHIAETKEPNLSHRDFYAEKFALYCRLRDHVKEESAFALGI